MTAEGKQEALARLSTTTALDALSDCSVIIEAAPEQPALKEKLFRDLSHLSSDAILASNTSSLSLTRLAAVCERPERVVGMHFFNPVPVLKLVEVIRAEQTSDATVERIEALTKALAKPLCRWAMRLALREPFAGADDQRGRVYRAGRHRHAGSHR